MLVTNLSNMTTMPLPSELHSDQGPNILALSWTECSLAILVVSARMYTRSRIVRNVGWDDWTMLFAMVSDISVL